MKQKTILLLALSAISTQTYAWNFYKSVMSEENQRYLNHQVKKGTPAASTPTQEATPEKSKPVAKTTPSAQEPTKVVNEVQKASTSEQSSEKNAQPETSPVKEKSVEKSAPQEATKDAGTETQAKPATTVEKNEEVKKPSHPLAQKLSGAYREKFEKLPQAVKDRIKPTASVSGVHKLLDDAPAIDALATIDELLAITTVEDATKKTDQIARFFRYPNEMILSADEMKKFYSLEIFYHNKKFKQNPSSLIAFLRHHARFNYARLNNEAQTMLRDLTTSQLIPQIIEKKDKKQTDEVLKLKDFLQLPPETVEKLSAV